MPMSRPNTRSMCRPRAEKPRRALRSSGPTRVRPASRNCDVGVRKIVALEQERLAHRLGEGVGETIAEIQLSRVRAAFAEIAIGCAGDIRMFPGDRLDCDPRRGDRVVEAAAG